MLRRQSASTHSADSSWLAATNPVATISASPLEIAVSSHGSPYKVASITSPATTSYISSAEDQTKSTGVTSRFPYLAAAQRAAGFRQTEVSTQIIQRIPLHPL